MLGVIGAMQEEIDLIISEASKVEKIVIAKKDIYICQIKNTKIVVALSGIGKVNASMTTQILISNFGVSQIINTGVAGSLVDDLELLNIIVAKDLIHHDMDAVEGSLGQIPRMDILAFPTDDTISNRIHEIAIEQLGNESVKIGRIASGDQFVSDFSRKCSINIFFNADAVEMESAAIAQVCYLNDVPFAIIRCISDKAGDEAMLSYEEFVVQGAQISSKIVLKYLEDYQ